MSTKDAPLVAFKARYVFPIATAPIADGTVTVQAGRIVSVGRDAPHCELRDLGDSAIVPGFVNAHAHLEFSDLRSPIGAPGTPLPDWIRQVIAYRRGAAEPIEVRIAAGLAECAATGTTAMGEIATQDWRARANLTRQHPSITMFWESIAPTPDRIDHARQAAEAFLAANRPGDAIRRGLSPHAPYTVQPRLLGALVELSRRCDVPMAMHLAESREELELLATRGGAFRTLLKDLDAWDPRLSARYPTVLDYLQELSRAPRALVIHGNYLAADEHAFLAAHRETMTVVYCPRTHAFFGHDRYPLAEMLAGGIRVALGTDGRSSNPDLSLFEELRCVAANHPQVAHSTVLELGTLAGARALGLGAVMGTIEPGKLAKLAVVELRGSPAEPHELLFASHSQPRSLIEKSGTL
jgi:cytosine/adenosine deaminase-related metal-dependent hydrolase